jgi:putative ABC transport system permease protein
MHLNDAFRSALQSISNHKLRSFLTLTGIVIGVLAVVTMFSSVYALKALINKNMEGMGWNNSILVSPRYEQPSARKQRGVVYRNAPKDVPPLNYSDLDAIRQSIPHKTIYGMTQTSSYYRIGKKSIQISLRGTNQAFFVTKTYPLKSGRYFNSVDEASANPVAILGYFFAEEQFKGANPVGRMINIDGNRFRIIGVLDNDKLNAGSGMNFNNWERRNDLKAVYVPLKYATTYITPGHMLGYIYVQSQDDASFAGMKNSVRQLLLSRHSMYQNFEFQEIGQIMMQVSEEIDKSMKKWNVTLFVIASISLIVGGIGLFSTLLISIQEKMLEIGVRKSIGATESDIFFYFIFEAITLAILGALIGIALASLALMGMQAALKFPLPMPVQGMAVGMFFSILIGFLSGLYPALKASGLDPIKAIYYFD